MIFASFIVEFLYNFFIIIPRHISRYPTPLGIAFHYFRMNCVIYVMRHRGMRELSANR